VTTRHWLATAFLAAVLTGCAPRENLAGAEVIWQSDDGQERVVRVGPCVKTQGYDDYSQVWRTTHTECAAESPEP